MNHLSDQESNSSTTERVKPRFEDAAQDIVSLLSSGYVLSNRDVAEVIGKNGYRTRNGGAPIFFMIAFQTKKYLEDSGIDLSAVSYRNRQLYYDASIDIADTDMDAVKSKIDKEVQASVRKGLATRALPDLRVAS